MADSLLGGAAGVLGAYSRAQDSALARDLAEKREKRLDAAEERAKAGELRAVTNQALFVDEKRRNAAIQARNVVLAEVQAERARAEEARRVAQENRAVEASDYNIGQRPGQEAYADQQLANARLTGEERQDAAEERARLADERVNAEQIMPLLAQKDYLDPSAPQNLRPGVTGMDILNKTPEIARAMLSRNQALMQTTVQVDGVPTQMPLTLLGFKYTDTSVVPIFENPTTGETVPATVGASDDPNSNLDAMTHAEFNELFNQSLVSVFNNGGSDSKAIKGMPWLASKIATADAQQLEIQASRDLLLEQMISQIFQDPAAVREAFKLISKQKTLPELQAFGEVMGLDLPALLKEQEVNNQAGTTATRALFEKFGEAESSVRDAIGMRSSEEGEMLGIIEDKTDQIRSSGGLSGVFDSQTEGEAEFNTAAEKWYDENSEGLATQMVGNLNIKDTFERLGAEEFYRKFAVDTAGNPVSSENIGSIIRPPEFDLNRDTIVQALNDGFKPTDEQVAGILEFMNVNDIKTQVDLVKLSPTLPPRAVLEVIWTTVSQIPGLTDVQRTTEAERMINNVMTGDPSTTQASVETARAKAIAEVKTAEEKAKLGRMHKKIDSLENDMKGVFDAQINPETGAAFPPGEQPPPSRKLAIAISQKLSPLFAAMRSSNSESDAFQEALSAASPYMSLMLQGLAADKSKDYFTPGWLTDTWRYISNTDVLGDRTDINLNSVRFGDDGTLVYSPSGGQKGRDVPISEIVELSEPVAQFLRLAANANASEK